MTRTSLYLNHDADYDWLIALEYGQTDDGQPPDNWYAVAEQFAYLLDQPIEGRCLGFKVKNFSAFDAEDEEVTLIRSGPRFDAPQLGLADAGGEETDAPERLRRLTGRSAA